MDASSAAALIRFPQSIFICLHAPPPPPSPSSVTLLDHVIMSCLRIRAEILRMPPKIKPFDGEGFSVRFTKEQQTGAGVRFLKLLQLHKKILTTATSYKEINPTKQISKSRIPLTTADNREQYRSTDPAREAVASLVVFHELHLLFLNHIRLLSFIKNKMCDTMSGAKLLKYRLT